MSVSPPPSDLRDDGLLQGLEKSLWGTTPPDRHPWLHLVLETRDADIARASRVLTLTVTMDRRHRHVAGTVCEVSPQHFGTSLDVADIETVNLHPEGVPRFIHMKVRGLQREITPYLFEYDPRIGNMPRGPSDFPEWPLFDPIPRLRPFLTRDQVSASDVVLCPLCGEMFTAVNMPMWGGGNVQWVHADCWRGSDPVAEHVIPH